MFHPPGDSLALTDRTRRTAITPRRKRYLPSYLRFLPPSVRQSVCHLNTNTPRGWIIHGARSVRRERKRETMYASHMGISGVSTNERFAWNNKDVRARWRRERRRRTNQFRAALVHIRNFVMYVSRRKHPVVSSSRFPFWKRRSKRKKL